MELGKVETPQEKFISWFLSCICPKTDVTLEIHTPLGFLNHTNDARLQSVLNSMKSEIEMSVKKTVMATFYKLSSEENFRSLLDQHCISLEDFADTLSNYKGVITPTLYRGQNAVVLDSDMQVDPSTGREIEVLSIEDGFESEGTFNLEQMFKDTEDDGVFIDDPGDPGF